MSYYPADGHEPDDEPITYPLPNWACCNSLTNRHFKDCIRDKSKDYIYTPPPKDLYEGYGPFKDRPRPPEN